MRTTGPKKLKPDYIKLKLKWSPRECRGRAILCL